MKNDVTYTLTVVSPVFKAVDIVEKLVERIHDEVSRLPAVSSFEILLVDDGSPDGSWEAIQSCCERYPCLRGVKLSRNFGQHAAIEAGLSCANSDYVVVMDCDLQEDPVSIGVMLDKALEGYDVVLTSRKNRAFSADKNLSAALFKKIINFLLPSNGPVVYDMSIGTMSLISRKVVQSFLSVGDIHKPYTAILNWL